MYNYSKLKGRLREQGKSQKDVAHEIGINSATLNKKINGKAPFKQKEISAICKVCNIPDQEIVEYFFAI